MAVWRHRKRGCVYTIVTHEASMQCSEHPEIEGAYPMCGWTVYKNVETGAIWIRPTKEFQDGRFKQLTGMEP